MRVCGRQLQGLIKDAIFCWQDGVPVDEFGLPQIPAQ